jgi:hypothetical protein
MHRFISLVAIAVFAIGCRSVDVASKHWGQAPKCEVHGTEMPPEWIRVSSGEIIHMTDYLDVVKQRFPHHGGVILSGERGYRYELHRRVRDFVCPECTHAYEAHWKARRR